MYGLWLSNAPTIVLRKYAREIPSTFPHPLLFLFLFLIRVKKFDIVLTDTASF